jgi:ADP-ribose pyrophosphatase YjhB (NUDIX family)
VSRIDPSSASQSAHGASFAELESNAEGQRFAPRITVAVIVAHPDDAALPAQNQRYLFVEEWVDERAVINQPAGHLDPNETLSEAAVRETLEETAWQCALEHLIAVYQFQTPTRAFVRFTFSARALVQTDRALDAGIIRTLWLTPEALAAEADRLRSPMVQHGLQRYLGGVRFPLDVVQALLP